MQNFDSPELLALIKQYTPCLFPHHRLCDLDTIGFVITRNQPHPDPTVNMPVVGQILAEPPAIDELTYANVMGRLIDGATLPISPMSAGKLRKLFDADDRYAEFDLVIEEVHPDCSTASLGRKEDQR